MSAGDLSVNINCSGATNYCETSLADNIWIGWIPFTFGDPVTLPIISASFSFSFVEAGGNCDATESVAAFNIVDGNVTPISGAYAIDEPEPPAFYLCAFGVAILVFRKYRPRLKI
jgi:hypothetical protein